MAKRAFISDRLTCASDPLPAAADFLPGLDHHPVGVHQCSQGNVLYNASSGIVTVQLPAISGTSNSVDATLCRLPPEITPQQDQILSCAHSTDNGTTAWAFGAGEQNHRNHAL